MSRRLGRGAGWLLSSASYFFIMVGFVLSVIPTPSGISTRTAIRLLTAAVYIVGGFILFELQERRR